jgi:hypothetical protein
VRDLYLFHLVVLLLRWFFNFVAPTCLVVVVVLHGSVGDFDCSRGIEKKTMRWLVVLQLVEVPMAILMSVFPLGGMLPGGIPGVGCIVELVSWRFSGCRLWLVVVIALLMISRGWIFALYRWCEMM